jgi:hypothetical protein
MTYDDGLRDGLAMANIKKQIDELRQQLAAADQQQQVTTTTQPKPTATATAPKPKPPTAAAAINQAFANI